MGAVGMRDIYKTKGEAECVSGKWITYNNPSAPSLPPHTPHTSFVLTLPTSSMNATRSSSRDTIPGFSLFTATIMDAPPAPLGV